jgi:signal transduction histidine kinase
MRRGLSWPSLVAVGLMGWILAMALSPAKSAVSHQDLAELARNAASGVFVIAGVLGLATWRRTAEPVVARRSVASFVIAASFPGTAAVGPLLHEPVPFTHSAPSTRALFLIPVLALLIPGARWSRQTFARPIPLRYLVVIGWVLGTGLGVVLFARHSLQDGALPASWRLLCCLSLFAWLLLAVRVATGAAPGASDHGASEGLARADGEHRARRGLMVACLLMAAAELFRLFALSGYRPVFADAPGVQLAAAVVLAVAAARALRAADHRDEEGTAQLVRTIADLQERMNALELADRERLHDARSAVAGVLGASELLGRRTDDDETSRLRRLITDELLRVHSVLDVHSVEPVADFDLGEALAPVVLCHQLHGGRVIDALDPIRVSGRPRATATVLDNLLRNASVHAPGAQVVVRTIRSGPFLSVVVEDDGPGITERDRARVLEPGVRGAHSGGRGEGLGLHSALTTMRAQGGSLSLDPREGGGTRVTFVLPLARDVAAPATPPRVVTLPDDRVWARGA